MITKSMLREYLKYVIPTVLTFTLAGFYDIVDGIFVGNAVGDAGLAGINVSWPVVALVTAVGTGVGMGGGVVSSLMSGAGNVVKSRRAIGTTFLLLILFSVPIMILLLAFSATICEFLGGRGEALIQATEYIGVIAWGVPFQILVTGCAPLIRNQGKVAYAMVVQMFAGCVNVILDYVFVVVMDLGTGGSAAATVISMVLAFVLVAIFFFKKDNHIKRVDLRLDGAIAKHALKLGLAPFGLTLLPEATVVVINMNLAAYGGELELAAYAVVSYTACVIQMLIQGVGDGSQPLISQHYGAGDFDKVRRFRNMNYLVTISLGVFGLLCMYLFRRQVPFLFGASDKAAELISSVLPVFSTAYIFYGFTHASTSYFYAIDDARASNTIVYSEGMLVILVVFGMAYFLGINSVWISVTVVQMLLSVLAAVFLHRRHRSRPCCCEDEK